MTDTTHTPGPWVLDGPGTAHITGDEDCYHCINGAEGWIDSNLLLSGFMLDADACLIAAAPDLLAALQALLEACEQRANTEGGDFGSGIGPAAALATAAIARAAGGAA